MNPQSLSLLIPKVRSIMGAKAKSMSDDQIARIVQMLYTLSKRVIQNHMETVKNN